MFRAPHGRPSRKITVGMLTRRLLRTLGAIAIATAAVSASACSSPDTTPVRYGAVVTSTARPGSVPAAQRSADSTPSPGVGSSVGPPPLPSGDGLHSSAAGLTFAPTTTSLGTSDTTFSFRIIGPDGRAITTFAREHT